MLRYIVELEVAVMISPQEKLRPLSTLSATPVMFDDSGPRRNDAAEAMSSTLCPRPRAVLDARRSKTVSGSSVA
jgi:hypothetical protein